MPSRFPLVKLPAKIDFTLRLIREELKSRKLFETLHEVGLDDCYFQPHLDELILSTLGIDDTGDEIFEKYNAVLKRRTRKIKADNASVVKQALKVYFELTEIHRACKSSKQS